MIWLRVPLALLLIVGGFLSFLPILGFWMMPLGLLLLAEDVPFLRRPTMKALAMVQRWWDRYSQRRKAAAGGAVKPAVTGKPDDAQDAGSRLRP
ncbi:hypothetical protein [Rhodovastum atsumiense]|uniref:Uncharacterized protein n=1 Tax=Rhodovastum atsumiense TaxID=504468 RepID=A0A5M6IRC2_9PROT|nr:hypothetical protein [Rhodovastum atsumiense]KAA5610833.1 hypothetical protein F1189_17280 [Rhodovastum atsumiense]